MYFQWIYIYTHTHLYVCIYIHICIYIFIYIYVSTYIFTCRYMLRDYAMAYNQISESVASLLRIQCFMCVAVYCSVLQRVVRGEYYATAYAL